MIKNCWLRVNGACYIRHVFGSGPLPEMLVWLNLLYVADFGVDWTNLFVVLS